MVIALMAASFLSRPWEEALDRALGAGVTHVEACGGGHIPRNHLDPLALSRDSAARQRFRKTVTTRAMMLSALSCHGNPLDPDASLAEQSHRDLIASCELAEDLGVPLVNALAGLPGGGPDDRVPNWIVPSVVPDFRDAYAWQWEERVLPYWSEAADVARRHGVRIAIEPHPATVVYNGETFDRLRDAVGDTVGMNYDPSHLWWQGIEPAPFLEQRAAAVYSVHIKDTLLRRRTIERDGVLSAADYHDPEARAWHFSTPGHAHDERAWGELVDTLYAAGYEGALSVECEDPRLNPDDTFDQTVALLRGLLPQHPLPSPDWPSVASTAREQRADA